jgi:hypothetical protein
MRFRNLLGAALLSLVVAAVTPMMPAAQNNGCEVSNAVKAADWTKAAEFWVSLGGTVLTLAAFGFGLGQYRSAQKWKRVEFVGQEMKAFFENPDVNNALIMIDWSSRHVDIQHVGHQHRKNWPVVTYPIQTQALRLHTLMRSQVDAEVSAATSGPTEGFTTTEARIRDTYDRLFDAWERFGAYLRSSLIEREDIEPYLEYWITDITRPTNDRDQALWNCALFAYIEFYGFKNVQFLMRQFDHDITANGDLYARFAEVDDIKPMADLMRQECQRRNAYA